MSEHRLVRFGLAALVIVLLLGAGAASLQQSAWSEGYMMGLIAGNDGGDALSQYVLYNSGRSPSAGGAIGGFFKIGLLIFGLLFIGKFFFGMAYMRRWQMAGGPDGPEGGEWQPGFRRHGPPWGCRQGESKPEQPDQTPAEPGPSTGSASTDVPSDVVITDDDVK